MSSSSRAHGSAPSLASSPCPLVSTSRCHVPRSVSRLSGVCDPCLRRSCGVVYCGRQPPCTLTKLLMLYRVSLAAAHGVLATATRIRRARSRVMALTSATSMA